MKTLEAQRILSVERGRGTFVNPLNRWASLEADLRFHGVILHASGNVFVQTAVERLAADGYGLIGSAGQYEHIWRMAYVGGPEVIIVARGSSPSTQCHVPLHI